MAFYDFIDVEEFDEKRNGCEPVYVQREDGKKENVNDPFFSKLIYLL